MTQKKLFGPLSSGAIQVVPQSRRGHGTHAAIWRLVDNGNVMFDTSSPRPPISLTGLRRVRRKGPQRGPPQKWLFIYFQEKAPVVRAEYDA